MARITVEDCLISVKNRFELVLLAAKRARQLAKNRDDATVERKDDKPTVVALREIAAGLTKEQVDNVEERSHAFVFEKSIEGEEAHV